MQNLRQADRPLKWVCPACHASIDCDVPYCGACGFGLPKMPRPWVLTFGSTVLFFLIGLPAGLLAIYLFCYMLMGVHGLAATCLISLAVSTILLRVMLAMSEGKRRKRL